MSKEELLRKAIQNFQDPDRTVVVWFHDDSIDEHYVGLAEDVSLTGLTLKIRFDWIIRVEHPKNGNSAYAWRPIRKSRVIGAEMTFSDLSIKSELESELELREQRDVINLYMGSRRLDEAQEISNRYEQN